MEFSSSQDSCLVSQEIKNLIEKEVIETSLDESRIQPSSFEPTIGKKGFILDSEGGVFRPKENQTVYKTLLELPKRKRQEIDITHGFEIKVGHSYLICLNEKIKKDPKFKFILSSPKSSIGRLFFNTRLLSDYNSSFDEIQNFPTEKSLNLWLLLQPLAFNAIISPDLTFNQLRFFTGSGAKLTANEILEVWKRTPLLWIKKGEGKVSPVETPKITNALQIHLDLEGKETGGIVALRARKNPHPIDLRKKEEYLAEEYFEPLKSKNSALTLKIGEHYLLSSKEVLNVPPHLNAELGEHSHLGLRGPLHRAGFIDNGFTGDLVFEVTSQEPTEITLNHNTPIGELHFFKTKHPEKTYGKIIGSHYHSQKGPKIAKYFAPFDFEFAAKNYAKLDKEVLVHDKETLLKQRTQKTGFESISPEKTQELLNEIEERGFFHSRYDCEEDKLILQIIPYTLIFGPDKTVFSYIRAKRIQDYGDRRLFGKHSIGLGGHVQKMDSPEFIINCLKREVMGEEVSISGNLSKPILLGTIFEPSTEVDKVHFGLIYASHTLGEVTSKESSIPSGKMIPISSIISDPEYTLKYETWSRVLIPLLQEFYVQIKN